MRIAVVTGSNKGIGYAIVKGLSKEFDGIIYLTARNEELGQQALKSIKEELGNEKHCEIRFHQLDITNPKSIEKLAADLKQEHGGLDVLINNAAISFGRESTVPFGEQAEGTMVTNFFGTLDCCRKLFPLLRPHARVVNVSSRAGLLKQVTSADLRQKLSSPNLTMDELCTLANRFVEAAKAGTYEQEGFVNRAYAMSKVFENAMTEIQQREFSNDKREDLIINSYHPGFVSTSLNNFKGPLTVEQGADTGIYLALIGPGAKEPKGKYLHERKEVDWKADE